MQYAFDLVEAAALWTGADPVAIRRQMDNSDYQKIKSNYEYELHQAQQNWLNWSEWFKSRREICLECPKELSCPEFDWQHSQDGTEEAVLQCPRGWHEKPPEEELSPYYFGVGPMPSLRKRYMPKAGEFTDLPNYVERIGWLKNALAKGELQGTRRAITAQALREWMQAHFPGEQPEFLYPSSSKAALSTHEAIPMEPVARQYKLNSRKQPLDAEITKAINEAMDPNDTQSVWDALTRLADQKEGCLVGKSSDGLQYRGKLFDDEGCFDTLTKKRLRDRLARRKKREV